MAAFEHLDPDAYRLPPDLEVRLLSPSLVVWLDKVRSNVATVIDALGGDPNRWRPHVKTTKMPAVWRELVAAGVRHFKCATPREAECLLKTLQLAGVEGDVLLSHPLVGPNLRLLADLAEQHTNQKVSVLVEDDSVLMEVPSSLGVFVDVNPGMDRTGIPVVETHRILELLRAAGSRLRGLHFYDGHHHQEGAERRKAVHAGYDELVERVHSFQSEGLRIDEIVTAGTPAFLPAAGHFPLRNIEGCIHRVSPGTVVFHDLRSQEQNPELELAPAALVFARVISQPREGRVTCDAGSKSIAAEAGDPVAEVLGQPRWIPAPPSEEHLPIEVTGGEAPVLGQGLLLVPRHICPTVNLAEEVVLLDGGEFVGTEAVAARAHGLLYS